ncbi:MAG: hypothetical protein EBR67_00705 [Proteobacteria bacterium]|nr:hypothetical protein [Pseudomonadota bacterium]
MRLNKFLADQGLCSRRQADLKISQGLVSVNAVTVSLGCCLESGDRVNYAGKEYIYNPESSQRLIYLALNKPAGVECTCNEEIEGSLIHFLEKNQDTLFPSLENPPIIVNEKQKSGGEEISPPPRAFAPAGSTNYTRTAPPPIPTNAQ